MQFIKQNVEFYPFPSNGMVNDEYAWAELIGRVCYHSEDKITEDSYVEFVNAMIRKKHYSVLEHVSFYMIIKEEIMKSLIPTLSSNPNLVRMKYDEESKKYYVTTNYRWVLENNLWDILSPYKSGYTYFHPRRFTFKITTSTQVTHELVRHRMFCYMQESSRFCNYTKDKFSGQIKFIAPSWYNENEFEDKKSLLIANGLRMVEQVYNSMIYADAKPQEAAFILPKGLATTIYMTGFEEDYWHLFDLRYFEKTGPVLPDMKEMMNLLYKNYLDVRGMKYNNDNFVAGIKKMLDRNNNKCPCSSNTSKDKNCPCSNMRESNECCCQLYVKK